MQEKKRKGEMITFAIGNRKGGVGKTQTAICTASQLVQLGYKVLLVDNDGQGNAAFFSGVNVLDKDRDQISLDNLYEEINPMTDNTQSDLSLVKHAIQETAAGYDIIEPGVQLNYAEAVYVDEGDYGRLKNILSMIKSDYDFCIIDTPPNVNALTINALFAADKLVIPMECDTASLMGLDDYCGVIDELTERYELHLKIAGVLLTRVDMRTNEAKAYIKSIDDIAQDYLTKAFSSVIRERADIKTSRKNQQDFMTKYKYSDAARDYRKFVKELLEDCEV